MSEKYNPNDNPGEEDRNTLEEPYVEWALPDAVERIDRGLSADILRTLQARLKLSKSELAELLMVSPRTLDRRKKEGTLPPDESERSFRIVRLTELASDILGDMESASRWFSESNFALGERKPMELVRTEPGARLVEQTLEQIRYGISP